MGKRRRKRRTKKEVGRRDVLLLLCNDIQGAEGRKGGETRKEKGRKHR
jgi:hypothetical protein